MVYAVWNVQHGDETDVPFHDSVLHDGTDTISRWDAFHDAGSPDAHDAIFHGAVVDESASHCATFRWCAPHCLRKTFVITF